MSNADESKAEARRERVEHLTSYSELTPVEVERLAAYEFDKGAATIAEQIDYYGLKVKAEAPTKAEAYTAAIAATGIDLSNNNPSDSDLQHLANAVGKFVASVLYTEDKRSATGSTGGKLMWAWRELEAPAGEWTEDLGERTGRGPKG